MSNKHTCASIIDLSDCFLFTYIEEEGFLRKMKKVAICLAFLCALLFCIAYNLLQDKGLFKPPKRQPNGGYLSNEISIYSTTKIHADYKHKEEKDRRVTHGIYWSSWAESLVDKGKGMES